MIKQLKQLRVLAFAAGCVVIVLPTFLCGCQSKEDRAEAHFQRAVAFQEGGDLEFAIVEYEHAIALKPDHAEAYHYMGNCLEMDEPERAIVAYKKAVAIKPDYARAYCSMGVAYHELEQYPDAIAAFKKAIAIAPDYIWAYCSMGIAYHELEQYPDAIAAFKKAIAIEPDYNRAYCALGGTYTDLGQYNDAIAAYKKAIAIEPDNPNDALAYFFLGGAYRTFEKHADAIAAYKRFIALKPAGPKADTARKYISELSKKITSATQPADKQHNKRVQRTPAAPMTRNVMQRRIRMTGSKQTFYCAPYGIDGESLGVGEWSIDDLSSKWKDVCDQILSSQGDSFRVSIGQELEHLEVKLTRTSGAGIGTLYVNGEIAITFAYCRGLEFESENDVLQMFVDSLRRIPLVQEASSNIQPFASILELKERPGFIPVVWANPNVSEDDYELVRELGLHFAGALLILQRHIA